MAQWSSDPMSPLSFAEVVRLTSSAWCEWSAPTLLLRPLQSITVCSLPCKVFLSCIVRTHAVKGLLGGQFDFDHHFQQACTVWGMARMDLIGFSLYRTKILEFVVNETHLHYRPSHFLKLLCIFSTVLIWLILLNQLPWWLSAKRYCVQSLISAA